jgi:hypothetical protein
MPAGAKHEKAVPKFWNRVYRQGADGIYFVVCE